MQTTKEYTEKIRKLLKNPSILKEQEFEIPRLAVAFIFAGQCYNTKKFKETIINAYFDGKTAKVNAYELVLNSPMIYLKNIKTDQDAANYFQGGEHNRLLEQSIEECLEKSSASEEIKNKFRKEALNECIIEYDPTDRKWYHGRYSIDFLEGVICSGGSCGFSFAKDLQELSAECFNYIPSQSIANI